MMAVGQQLFTRHVLVNADNKFVQGGYVCTRCKLITSNEEKAFIDTHTADAAVPCQEVSIAQVMERIRASIRPMPSDSMAWA